MGIYISVNRLTMLLDSSFCVILGGQTLITGKERNKIIQQGARGCGHPCLCHSVPDGALGVLKKKERNNSFLDFRLPFKITQREAFPRDAKNTAGIKTISYLHLFNRNLLLRYFVLFLPIHRIKFIV